MKKELRVRKNYEFSSIIQKRKSVKSPAFVLYFDEARQPHARAGISVGKKNGHAVVRTRVKRQMRALIDEVFTFEEPFDFIIVARQPFLKMDYAELKEEMEKLRRRALHRFPRKEDQ